MQDPVEEGKRLWAFMNAPENQTTDKQCVHINWGSIPVLLLRSEEDCINYYKSLLAPF